MGLAVLPDRLVSEMKDLEMQMAGKETLEPDALPEAHNKFAYLLKVLQEKGFVENNTFGEALKMAIGEVFVRGLEHCGVYGAGEDGQYGVKKFLDSINAQS